MSLLEDVRTPAVGGADNQAARDRLHEIWETRPGLLGWFASVDHKEIGQRYMVTALVFLLLGGLEALVMRAQLAAPNERLLTPSNTISCSPCTASA